MLLRKKHSNQINGSELLSTYLALDHVLQDVIPVGLRPVVPPGQEPGLVRGHDSRLPLALEPDLAVQAKGGLGVLSAEGGKVQHRELSRMLKGCVIDFSQHA